MTTGQIQGSDPTRPVTASSVIGQSSRDDGGTERKAPLIGRNMVLTDEEREVLKECDNEGFYAKALPMSIGSGLAAHMLVKSGRMKGHPILGALPSVVFYGSLGFVIGRIIYVPVCQEKILHKIPHSNLAAAVRKAKGMPVLKDDVFVSVNDEFSNGSASNEQNDDYGRHDPFSRSSEYPYPGLDDRFRPSVDREVKPREEPPEEESKPKMTYEELRRRNRQQYEESRAKRSDSPRAPSRSMPPHREGENNQYVPPSSDQPRRKQRTNRWGDVIED